MVTRRNRPEIDAATPEEELRALLEERELEVERLQRRIRDLELLADRFLSSASHAVMNPVTIIRSYLEIMLSDLQTGLSDEQLEFLKTAHAAALRLNRLIDRIVEVAALEIGAAELDCGMVDVGGLVAEACQSGIETAESAGVDLSVSVAPQLPRVRADGDRLASAVAELVANAIRATPSGGRVEVTLRQRDTDIVIGVSDTGTGIPEDQLPRVFEPFVRLPGREGVSRRGAGLGLSLAKLTVEAMGGRLEVSSEVGSGTSVEILLPVSAVSE